MAFRHNQISRWLIHEHNELQGEIEYHKAQGEAVDEDYISSCIESIHMVDTVNVPLKTNRKLWLFSSCYKHARVSTEAVAKHVQTSESPNWLSLESVLAHTPTVNRKL